MNLDRLENESAYNYHKRLVYGKLVDKVVDADYSELAPYVYGKEYSSDVARRMMYGSRETLDIIEDDISLLVSKEGKDVASDLLWQKAELQKERVKLQAEKAEYNKWIREDGREELFLEKILEAVKECDAPPIIPIPRDNKEGIKEGVLCFADSHFGKEFKIFGLNDEVLNQYSPEIFYERMNDMLAQTIEIANDNNLKKIKVLFLGDALDGFIRHSQLMTLRYGVVDSAIYYGKFMAKWLRRLSKDFLIEYHQVCGNHGELRLLDGRKNEHLNDNIEKVTLELIKAYNVDNPNLTVIENKSGNIFTNVCGYNIVGIHGETKDPGKTMKDFISVYGESIDYLICGHKHHSSFVNCGYKKYVIGIGSIVGSDDFSMRIRRSSEASANFLIFKHGKGRIVDYSIILN